MNTRNLFIITIIKLTTIIVGQAWPPYETYNSYPYQGYGGRCANIILTGVSCQQLAGQWNLYPDYQLQNYNRRPYTGIMPRMFVPLYGSDRIIPQSNEIMVDLLNGGLLLDSSEEEALDSSALAPKLFGANILNDKNRFMVHGCSYDVNHSKCTDNLNFCKGKCKNFGDNLTHDCKCVPEDLLTMLGLTTVRK